MSKKGDKGKHYKTRCGQQYSVTINGKVFIKFCNKKAGHWGRHG